MRYRGNSRLSLGQVQSGRMEAPDSTLQRCSVWFIYFCLKTKPKTHFHGQYKLQYICTLLAPDIILTNSKLYVVSPCIIAPIRPTQSEASCRLSARHILKSHSVGKFEQNNANKTRHIFSSLSMPGTLLDCGGLAPIYEDPEEDQIMLTWGSIFSLAQSSWSLLLNPPKMIIFVGIMFLPRLFPLGKDVVNMLQLRWIRRCLKYWAVIGRHGSWGLSCLYPVYMSCVHRRTFHQYNLYIVVQYIYTWIYKPICPWVCPVYMSCTFLIHRCGDRGRTWAFPVSGNLEFFSLSSIFHLVGLK
jgi:hypothetical protein